MNVIYVTFFKTLQNLKELYKFKKFTWTLKKLLNVIQKMFNNTSSLVFFFSFIIEHLVTHTKFSIQYIKHKKFTLQMFCT